MPLEGNGRRQRFVDRALLYLFSYDVELNADEENLGFVPGGVRTNVRCLPNRSRIYHLLREPLIGDPGGLPVNGTITWGKDTAVMREDDTANGLIRLIIETTDGAHILSEYAGIFAMGPGGYHEVIRRKGPDDEVGRVGQPRDARIVVLVRYETSDPRYDWLTQHQCIGYGRVSIVRGLLRRVTYDIYAMD